MKKRLMVLALTLVLVLSLGGAAWASGEGLEDIGIQLNSDAETAEPPEPVKIIRPLGSVLTDANLFVSAQIFDGLAARLFIHREVTIFDFAQELNLIGSLQPRPLFWEPVFESRLIERGNETVFYFEEPDEEAESAADSALEAEAATEAEDPAQDSEEALLIGHLETVFGTTTETGLEEAGETAGRDVLFYCKKLENVVPGRYRIRFEAYGEAGALAGSVEKIVTVRDISLMDKTEEEIRKEIQDILSNSFTGLVSR